MDLFEKHIRENASQFNEHTADRAKLWEAIAQELEAKPLRHRRPWFSPWVRVAAAVVLFLGIAAALIPRLQEWNNGPSLGSTTQELRDIDNHYQGLVSHQVQLVRAHPKLSEADKEEFLSFMDELDSEYKELRSALQDNLDNEQVLEAIIANYKKRLELIAHLLRTLKDQNPTHDHHGYTL